MEPAETTAPRRSRLGADLAVLSLIGALLLAAIGAGGVTLYQQFYSPSAFVSHYLELLSAGRAADALRVPGVALDRDTLKTAGIESTASEALLRHAALAPLTDIAVTGEKTEKGVTAVSVSYRAGRFEGQSTFSVEQDGWIGVAPNWRFRSSPLAAVDLTVLGADRFAVNGFEVDRRQVSVDGTAAAPLDPLPLLVFTPGLYAVTVDTAISHADGVALLADTPLATTQITVQTEPTEKFVTVVQQRVEEFLTQCTSQQVLQPTACPFGYEVRDRVSSAPVWSIATQPVITVVPDGANWRIPPTDALAHIDVEVQSLFDGAVKPVAEDVPFQVDGTIAILPDGSASIKVGSPESPPEAG